MLLFGTTDIDVAARAPGVVDRAADRLGAMPLDDRYLSGAALADASAALRGLADTLRRVRGPFADDAADDADRLRTLADDLAAWCPPPAPVVDRDVDRGPRGGSQWAGLLRAYFGRGLAPCSPTPGPAISRRG